ncbi:MFS transporter TsgA, partial [Francisella tularensis subsp. holarctica]|nr:MFS transporter TsgA [Francisella tularensis subsp. holarctica]
KTISYFWTALCVGLFISPIITRFIPLKYIILTFILIGLAVLSCILYIPDMSTVFIAAIIFGLFNCFIYAGILAYGTLL